MKFTECSKIVKRIAFEKAISVSDTKKSVVDQINLESMSMICLYLSRNYFIVNYTLKSIFICNMCAYYFFIFYSTAVVLMNGCLSVLRL